MGRHAVLNLALAASYLNLAVLAISASGRAGARLRPPLRVLAGVIGALGVLTAVRGPVVPFTGVGPLFDGFGAQVYYGYSTLVAVILGPNLLWMVLSAAERAAHATGHP